MKKKYNLFFGCVLAFPMLLLISTACNTPVDTLTGGTSYYHNYIITQNGDINDPNDITTEKISSDYNTFLIVNDFQNRKIYFGGKLPDYYCADQVNINCDAFGLNNDTGYITKFQLTTNGPYYYYIPFSVYSSFGVTPNEYEITVKLQNNGTVKDQIVRTLKVADAYARNWTLDVYEQAYHSSIYFTQEKLKDAFNEMQVPLVVEVKSSSLAAEIINWDRTKPYAENELIVYAYRKVYPLITNTSLAMATYASDHPNKGLLFYIMDYNITGGDPDTLNGITFASGSTVARLPVVYFVFVKRIRDNWATYWENHVINATTIHEAGHLWCEGFTNQTNDQTTHTLWHNGDNLKRCVMIDPYVMDQNHNPDPVTQKVLEYSRFCEGHLQRGLNVSWYLKQYAPFGQNNNGGNQDLYAYTGNLSQLKPEQGGDELQINIESDKSEYIKGQLIDILVRIKNNTNETVKLYPAEHHLYSYEESKTINSTRNTVEYTYLTIPPHQEYVYLVNPLKFINHKNEDKGLLPGLPWYYWPEGSYEYYVSYKLNNVVYTSNKIFLVIKSVPDSLILAFEDLKDNINNPPNFNPLTYRTDRYEVLFEKYQGTFYEKEFSSKLLTNWNYTYAIANKKEAEILRERAMELYKEFILKYPSTEAAFYYLINLYSYRDKGNENLLKEISSSLSSNKAADRLFQVLHNQKEYWFKEIDDYGF